MSEDPSTSPNLETRNLGRRTVVWLMVAGGLLVAACGGGTSQDELERRIVVLEDELERIATATTEPGPATTVAPPTTAAPTTTAPPPTTTTAPPVTTTSLQPTADELFFDARGFGPIEAGMTLRTVQGVAGVDVTVDSEIFEVFEGYCYYATIEESRFVDLSLLIVSPDDRPVQDPLDGVVGSVSAYRSGPTTREGVGVGSTEADVFAAYPDRISISPHEYLDGGHYLDVSRRAADGTVFYLRFATDGEQVTSISTGSDAALAVEGCA